MLFGIVLIIGAGTHTAAASYTALAKAPSLNLTYPEE